MYFDTVEEENGFLSKLRKEFDEWMMSKRDDRSPVSECIPSGLLCPKCRSGKILNHGEGRIDRDGLLSYGMKHVCESCGEEFDRIRIEEDIYDHSEYEMVDAIETPLGSFRVLRNGEAIRFRHWTLEREIKGVSITAHRIDIDTSMMAKGDKVIAGISGARSEFVSSDEREAIKAAGNSEYYLTINGEEINDLEEDIADYTFISVYGDEDWFEYLIHQDPGDLSDIVRHGCRVIMLTMAWERKSICQDYEQVIEMAAW